MRVEVVEEAEGTAPATVFPPSENYFDLRANPQAIEQIAAARQYLPLRNFLASVNGAESIFTTASVTTKSDFVVALAVAKMDSALLTEARKFRSGRYWRAAAICSIAWGFARRSK